MSRYKVHCLEAKYDEEEGMMTLNCFFYEFGEKRLVILSKSDFTYKGNPCPHIEMHRTAQLFRNKVFFLDVSDDPNRVQIKEEEMQYYAATFNKRITDELQKVSEGLVDPNQEMSRKLQRILEKERGK